MYLIIVLWVHVVVVSLQLRLLLFSLLLLRGAVFPLLLFFRGFQLSPLVYRYLSWFGPLVAWTCHLTSPQYPPRLGVVPASWSASPPWRWHVHMCPRFPGRAWWASCSVFALLATWPILPSIAPALGDCVQYFLVGLFGPIGPRFLLSGAACPLPVAAFCSPVVIDVKPIMMLNQLV